MPSTVIRDLHYLPDLRVLVVTFVDGDRYAYFGVSPEAHAAFRASGSKGRHFAREVRGRYAFRKLDAGDLPDPDLSVPA